MTHLGHAHLTREDLRSGVQDQTLSITVENLTINEREPRSSGLLLFHEGRFHLGHASRHGIHPFAEDSPETPIQSITLPVELTVYDFNMDRRHLPREESILEAALDHINHGVVIYDQDLIVLRINRRAREILHVPADMFSVGEPFEKLARLNASRGGYGGTGLLEERIAKRVAKARTFAPFKEDQQIFDGTTVEVFGRPIPGEGYVITYTDITARRKAEIELVKARDELERRVESRTVELRESEAQLRLVTDNVPALIAYLDRDFIIRFANQPYAEDAGISQRDIVGMHLRDVRGERRFKETWHNVTRTLAGEVTSNAGKRHMADGSLQYFRTTRVPHFGDGGEVHGYFMIFIDLTEHHEREEQLRQAQKMEAVGQLTGGVAHDFNNLLAVIMGNAELLKDQRGSEDASVNAIYRAATRGSELTDRLLAFSRRHPLHPQSIDLGELVTQQSEMLGRILGETIEVTTNVARDLRKANADLGQVENALLNLAINARDAMPQGGRLTIDCANEQLDQIDVADDQEATPGNYVVLAVSDTGTGMSAEVQAKVFEPFFTTKEIGKGSGLGLSMVYGFAKQSGGHANIYSEEGRGTTVKLYLPQAEETSQRKTPGQNVGTHQGRGESVLLIEDDADVRDLVTTMLEGLSYRVIMAQDAAEARELLVGGRRVDLVLSDVVLPGDVSGPELAESARVTNPDLKVVFMSGYSEEAAKDNGFLGSDQVLLNKPFQRQQLAEALRQALD